MLISIGVALTAGVSAVSEKISAGAGVDTQRRARDIANRLEHCFSEQAWIPAGAVKWEGEFKMKKLYRIMAMSFFAMMTSVISSGPAASADDNSCWLQAEQGLYLTVYDLDSLGSILSQIWEGVLEPGSKKRIKSTNGKIRYYTNVSSSSSSPGINLTCHNKEVISVP